MSSTREVIADYCDHVVGECEVVDWTRPDGRRYNNVPLVFIKKVDRAAYMAQFPHMQDRLEPSRCYFWEVSID